MPESLSVMSEKAGLPPGSLVHVGDIHDHDPSITLVQYNSEQVEIRILESATQIPATTPSGTVTWIIVNSLRDVSVIAEIGRL